MREQVEDQRRLAPDSWKILGVLGTGALIIIGVTQYQIDRGAELVLERARSSQVTPSELREAFRPRDEKIMALEANVAGLREERAKVGQALENINATMSRIVDVSIQTQSQASQTEGQLKQLLKQTETNATLVGQIVDRNRHSFQTISERLTRLEGSLRPLSPSGTP